MTTVTVVEEVIHVDVIDGASVTSVQKVADDLSAHEGDTENPHSVTAAQAGADPSGSAAIVAGALSAHEGDTENPHSVTAAQAGADPSGSAAIVAGALSDHAALSTTAHGGIVADSDSRLTDARTPTAHASTHATGQSDAMAASDIGADAAGTASALVGAHAAAIYSEAHPLPIVPMSSDPGVDAAMQALADAGIITYEMLYIFNDDTTHDLTGIVGDSVWYPNVIERQPGQVVLFDTTITDVTQTVEFGFDTDEAGSIDANAARITGSDLKPVDGGTIGPDIAYPTSGTPYQLGVILRAAGAFYMSGDTLLSIHGADASTPVYAGFANTSATGTVDGVRAPQDLWAPTPIAADTGTSADVAGTYYTDGGTLTGIEAGGDGEAWNGATWLNGPDGAKNTPALGAELVTNGGFENWTGSTPDGWTKSEVGSSVVLENTTDSISGSSCELNVDGSASNVLIRTANTLEAGYYYSVTINHKSSLVGKILAGVAPNYVTIDTDSLWQEKSIVYRPTETSTFLVGRYFGIGPINYLIDDVSVKEIPTADLFRSITTGTTPYIYAEVEGTLGDGTQLGTVLMLDDAADPQNFVIVYHDGTSVFADKYLAGVYTNLFTVAAAEVPGVLPTATTRDNGDGTAQLWVWYDGAFIAEQEIADAGIVANTLYGEFSTSDTNRITNFTAYNTGGHTPPGA